MLALFGGRHIVVFGISRKLSYVAQDLWGDNYMQNIFLCKQRSFIRLTGWGFMTYSYTEKKRIRKDFGKLQEVLEAPFLLATQIDSYQSFLYSDAKGTKTEGSGLDSAFKSVFPIISHSGHVELQYVGYELAKPEFNIRECQLRGLTYASSLRVKLKLVIYDKDSSKKKVKKIMEPESVFMGDMPPILQVKYFTLLVLFLIEGRG